MQPETPIEVFRAWSPSDSPWSAWAKPVLFVHGIGAVDGAPTSGIGMNECPLLPESSAGTCVVIDLPGLESVTCALQLAERGFRPVPLYNATRGATGNLIDVSNMCAALAASAPRLRALAIAADAPPAFMIDSRRLEGSPEADKYDNRWIVLPQDFPSARRLKDAGISKVMVVRRGQRMMQHDLRAILRLWRQDGLEVLVYDTVQGTVTAPTFDLTWAAALGDHIQLVFHGLFVNSTGGFGGVVPAASQGGGFA